MNNILCRAIPYEGQESYLFISYCHQDSQRLYPLFEQMVASGFRMWYDDGNHGGDDWLENIENHLENCSAVIAFISANSSLSHNCKSEVVYAQKCKKKVIPVLIEDTQLPKGLRMQLCALHHLESWKFPSDAALLQKIGEGEECQACKGPAGSLQLKPASIPEPMPESESLPSEKSESVPVAIPKKNTTKVMLKRHIPSQKPESPIHEETFSKKLDPLPPQEEIHPFDALLSSLPDEATIVPRNEPDVDSTVCGFDDSEKTIIPGLLSSDCDKTVYVSRNAPALLVCPNAERVHILTKPQTKIGRSPIKCDVVIESEFISKCHAEIIQYQQKFFLQDDNSSNGTFLNGEQLPPEEKVLLESPAVFRLNDETLILFFGSQVKQAMRDHCISYLVNDENAEICLIDTDAIHLDRSHPWPRGTFKTDKKVHRGGHALLTRKEDGIYLTDVSAANGTFLTAGDEEERLSKGEEYLLHSGNHIRLGDTILTFVSINF